MSKKVKELNQSLILDVADAVEDHEEIREEREQNPRNDSDDILKSFAFNIDKDQIDFIRDFVSYKRRSAPEFYHFNQSMAFREGIELMQEKESFPFRPESVKVSTSRGTTGHLNGMKKIKTSFSLSERIINIIYDIIYHKSRGDRNNYGKRELMADVIVELKNKYKLK